MSTWYEVEIRNDYGTWDPFVESIYETAATQHRTREEAEEWVATHSKRALRIGGDVIVDAKWRVVKVTEVREVLP